MYIGLQLPEYAQDQFSAGQPWHLLPGRHAIDGGHCVPIVGAQTATLADVFTLSPGSGVIRSAAIPV